MQGREAGGGVGARDGGNELVVGSGSAGTGEPFGRGRRGSGGGSSGSYMSLKNWRDSQYHVDQFEEQGLTFIADVVGFLPAFGFRGIPRPMAMPVSSEFRMFGGSLVGDGNSALLSPTRCRTRQRWSSISFRVAGESRWASGRTLRTCAKIESQRMVTSDAGDVVSGSSPARGMSKGSLRPSGPSESSGVRGVASGASGSEGGVQGVS